MILSTYSEVYRRYKQREQLIDWYEPLPYQREAFLSTKPIQLFEGGNRSGKTQTAIAKLVCVHLDKHPTIKREHPIKSRIIASVLREGAQGIILNKLKQLMPYYALLGGNWKNAYNALDSIIKLRNGDTIQLMASTQDIQTHRGDDLDMVVVDEECKEEIFDENLTRLADRNGLMIMAMTPHNGMTWTYRKLVKASRTDQRIGYFHLETLQNHTINREEWIKNSALLSDKEFAIRVKGERIANEGLVYFMISDKTHMVRPFELPQGTHLFLGVDFGINNPHAGSLWAITPENKKFIVDEYYETELTVGQNAEAMGRWLKTKWGKYRVRWAACDPNSGAQRDGQTNETNINVFAKALARSYEKYIPVLPGDRTKGCLEHRINVMRELLTVKASGLPDIMLFSSCVNHMNEFEEYVWGSRKDEQLNQFERPKDAHNHLMNACEYVAERNPRYMSVVAPIQRRAAMNELQYGSIGR